MAEHFAFLCHLLIYNLFIYTINNLRKSIILFDQIYNIQLIFKVDKKIVQVLI